MSERLYRDGRSDADTWKTQEQIDIEILTCILGRLIGALRSNDGITQKQVEQIMGLEGQNHEYQNHTAETPGADREGD